MERITLNGEPDGGSAFKSRPSFDGLEHTDGIDRLWFAVLVQAFRDFYGDIPREGTAEYREAQLTHCRRLAKIWFKSEANATGSFRWIAELFNLDARAVRKRLFHGPRIELTEVIGEVSEESIGSVALVVTGQGGTPRDDVMAA